jgi:hypothetical protein
MNQAVTIVVSEDTSGPCILYGDGGALGAVGREHAERHRKMSNDLKNIDVDATTKNDA